MNSKALRQLFIDYFHQRGHQVEPSASLVPGGDATLLFTNAGMVPFKDVFLGHESRDYTRATSSQRCVRAGGKHNDLENVGYTARHHTFFEMLGNFSFGDYFKREAIEFAWDFLTKVLEIPAEKLWVTVFDQDEESADIWLNQISVDQTRFSRIGEKDNFWAMGDTGPCGPCTEIFYDHGPDIAGGPPGTPEEEGDRYTEIWNLVFMQYNRQADGELKPLPKPSVDTGMGLERLAAVMQGVHNNYDTDLFVPLIKAMAKIANCDNLADQSLRVIADHIRSTSFLIADGVIPSNEGHGYVLRRIIRRAIRHGNKLGVMDQFFYKLVQPLVEIMAEAHPVLKTKQAKIEQTLKQEEQQFSRTLAQGLKLLEQQIVKLDGDKIDGAVIFKLYDTYGFPVDLTADIAREKGLKLDMPGFEQSMQVQRKRARDASQFASAYQAQGISIDKSSDFSGYDNLCDQSEVLLLLKDQQTVDSLQSGDKGVVILAQTPFYPEAGGQVGDSGVLNFANGEFRVDDTQKQANAIMHYGELIRGGLKTGMSAEAAVDQDKRKRTAANHSVTHLLHAAMHQLIGSELEQKGSLVAPDRLRFDFSHNQALSQEQLFAIEVWVNRQIRTNHLVETTITSVKKAKAMGAMALFGEKYGQEVRVLKMGKHSIELCAGTHVKQTGDIGYFKIISEGSIASGIRRIEAVTGAAAIDLAQKNEAMLLQLQSQLKSSRTQLSDNISQTMAKLRQSERTINDLKGKAAGNLAQELAAQSTTIGDINLISAKVEGIDGKALRGLIDQLKNQSKRAVIVLGLVNNNKVSLAAGVSPDLTAQLSAGKIINHVAAQVGGKGGGRADMAQAGGSQPENLDKALASVKEYISI